MVQEGMDSMPISKFKATCLAVLERVRVTGKPLRITRFGKPVADIVPPKIEAKTRDWIGSMAGTIKIVGDIISPTIPLEDYDLSAGRLVEQVYGRPVKQKRRGR
jgi:antitoxin (DNA-binding transcriptional repressor) of toxin-antitoxin stability system